MNMEAIRDYYKARAKKEIQTIAPRSITLNLSDADVKRLWEKAGRAGMTMSELLEKFIGDLVDGTYSNGSDERDLAQNWFERTSFGSTYAPAVSLLQYLVREGILQEALDEWNEIVSLKMDLYDDDESITDADRAEITDLLEDAEDRMEELCGEYITHEEWKAQNRLESFCGGEYTAPKEWQKVLDWKREMQQMLARENGGS